MTTAGSYVTRTRAVFSGMMKSNALSAYASEEGNSQFQFLKS